MRNEKRIIAAGHLCLDIVPEIQGATDSTSQQMFKGGQLTQIGPVTLTPGGAVANTGQALRILGVDTLLMGKVGDDRFGNLVAELLANPRPGATLPGRPAMSVDKAVSTSYTLVLTPPDIDRVYFHCSGANDTFSADDVDYDLVATADLFHFGYPPLMARMFEGEGEALAELYRKAAERGVATSLDMAMPDPGAAAGRAPWRKILEHALPYVDIALPSAEEIVAMLHPEWLHKERSHQASQEKVSAGKAEAPLFSGYTLEQLWEVGEELIEMGCRVVVLKLGEDGLYVRTRLGEEGRSRPLPKALAAVADEFGDRELISPCFTAEVVSAVGAGDTTIAGFLAGVIRELPLERCVELALAVGAKSVEGLHSTGSIPPWDDLVSAIDGGWERRPLRLDEAGWKQSGGFWERE